LQAAKETGARYICFAATPQSHDYRSRGGQISHAKHVSQLRTAGRFIGGAENARSAQNTALLRSTRMTPQRTAPLIVRWLESRFCAKNKQHPQGAVCFCLKPRKRTPKQRKNA
jgi:hypothetical protein